MTGAESGVLKQERFCRLAQFSLGPALASLKTRTSESLRPYFSHVPGSCASSVMHCSSRKESYVSSLSQPNLHTVIRQTTFPPFLPLHGTSSGAPSLSPPHLMIRMRRPILNELFACCVTAAFARTPPKLGSHSLDSGSTLLLGSRRPVTAGDLSFGF